MAAANRVNGRFAPGVSGNPAGGRLRRVSRSLAMMVRAHTGDGKELVRHALDVMRGTATSERSDGEKVYPSIKEQSEARNWLAERAFGRPAQCQDLPPENLPLPDESESDAQVLELLKPQEIES